MTKAAILVIDWCDNKLTWDEYKARFMTEIKNNPKAIQAMKILESGYDVVTLYASVLMRNIVIDP